MKKLLAFLILAAVLSSMIIPINAETNLAIYVCDGGNGDGTSPSSPVGTLEKAYEIIFERSNVKNDPSASAIIVICGKLTVADHFNYDGNYSVMIGGNAFVSRLVMGETCKYGTNIESSSLIITENATIKELYVAGDYAYTENVAIEIHSGKVEKLIHSRNQGGSAGNLKLILTATDLLPQSIDTSHPNVITGQKMLILHGEPPADTSSWDIVEIIPSETEPADETAPLPESAPDNKPYIDNTNPKTQYELPARIIAAVVLITVFLLVIIKIAISHQKKKKTFFIEKNHKKIKKGIDKSKKL